MFNFICWLWGVIVSAFRRIIGGGVIPAMTDYVATIGEPTNPDNFVGNYISTGEIFGGKLSYRQTATETPWFIWHDSEDPATWWLSTILGDWEGSEFAAKKLGGAIPVGSYTPDVGVWAGGSPTVAAYSG